LVKVLSHNGGNNLERRKTNKSLHSQKTNECYPQEWGDGVVSNPRATNARFHGELAHRIKSQQLIMEIAVKKIPQKDIKEKRSDKQQLSSLGISVK